MRVNAFVVSFLLAFGAQAADTGPIVSPVLGTGVAMADGSTLIKVGAKGGLFRLGTLKGGGLELVLPVTVGMGASTLLEVYPGVEYHHPFRGSKFGWYGNAGLGIAHSFGGAADLNAAQPPAQQTRRRGQAPAAPAPAPSGSAPRTDLLARVGGGLTWTAFPRFDVYLEPMNLGFYSRAPVFVEYAAFAGVSYTF